MVTLEEQAVTNLKALSHLSDEELIQVILRLFEQRDIDTKAKKLVHIYKDLSGLVKGDITAFRGHAELDKRSEFFFILLNYCLRRINRQKLQKNVLLIDPARIVKYCNLIFEKMDTEKLAVFYLDNRYRLIFEEVSSNKDTNRVTLDTDHILRTALLHKVKGILVVHNHPSGVLKPSREDIDTTKKLSAGLEAIRVELCDHLIINQKSYYSFKQHYKSVLNKTFLFSPADRMQYIALLVSYKERIGLAHSIWSQSKDINSLDEELIKKYMKKFKNLGIAVTEEWIKTGQGKISLNESTSTYKTTKLRDTDISYLKFMHINSPIYFSYLDNKYRFIFVSNKYKEIFNLTTEEIIGQKLHDLIGDQGYHICKPFLDRALKGEEVSFSYPWLNSNMEVKNIRLTYIPDFADTNKVKGIYCFLEDNLSANEDGKYISSIKSILPVIMNKKEQEYKPSFFKQVHGTLEGVLKSFKFRYDHRVLNDLASNVYETFYEEESINIGYIKSILKTAQKLQLLV